MKFIKEKNYQGRAQSSESGSGPESTFSPDLGLKHLSFLLILASQIIDFWMVSRQTWVWEQMEFLFLSTISSWLPTSEGKSQKKGNFVSFPITAIS